MKKLIVLFSTLAIFTGSAHAFTLQTPPVCPKGYTKVVEGNPERPEKICCVLKHHQCREIPNCQPSADGKYRKVTHVNGTTQAGDTCSTPWIINNGKCCAKDDDDGHDG